MMKERSSRSANPWDRGFELSYKLAREQLANVNNTQEQCVKSGARYLGPHEVIVDYLSKPYHILLPDARIVLEDDDVEIPLRDSILILHYFALAKGTPATGRLITYQQVPGGVSYFSAFHKRTITPLVKHFGTKPGLLKGVSAKLGGYETDRGDESVTINAFPHVPITLVLWRGDDEVAPNGTILFDANVSDYLSSEDVAVLSETIAWKLVRSILTT
jgi:hypothetical protein